MMINRVFSLALLISAAGSGYSSVAYALDPVSNAQWQTQKKQAERSVNAHQQAGRPERAQQLQNRVNEAEVAQKNYQKAHTEAQIKQKAALKAAEVGFKQGGAYGTAAGAGALGGAIASCTKWVNGKLVKLEHPANACR